MNMSSTGLRRVFRAVLIAAIAGFAAPIAVASPAAPQLGWGDAAKFNTTRESIVPHVADKPLEVKTDNGTIKVVPATGDTVTVTAKVRATTQERLDGATVQTTRAPDGSLSISVKWPGNARKGSEGCDFEVAIPGVSRLNASTSNGAIDVRGLSGPAVLGTSNGAITVGTWNGAVKADTSNGQITVTGAEGRVDAASSNGRITITDAAGAVTAESSNATVNVTLRSSATGPVHVDTSNGAVHVKVGRAFVGALHAKTNNGRLNMKGATPTGKPGKAEGTWQFGEGGEASEVESSNGSITVEVVE